MEQSPIVTPHHQMIAAGTPVDVLPKNPFTSTTIWGIIVALVFGFLSKRSWWIFDKGTTATAMAEITSYAGLLFAAYGRTNASRPLGFHTTMGVRHITRGLAPFALLLFLVGCGASNSYKLAVGRSYPVVADRMDQLAGAKSEESQLLRDAAAAQPITLGVAGHAWDVAGNVYRDLVTRSTTLSEHRRADWLTTADLLTQLNLKEKKHEGLLPVGP